MSKKSSGQNASAIQNKYISKTYDRTTLLTSKESNLKQIIKDHAEKHGESVNGFITRAVLETMQREKERDI